MLKEPSVVAFDRDSNVIKAIGEDARLMLGRTPGNIVAVRPLRQGVISDYTVTEKMTNILCRRLGKQSVQKAEDQHLCAERSDRGGEESGRRSNFCCRSKRSASD